MISRRYVVSVTIMAAVIPLTAFAAECNYFGTPYSFAVFGKWFIFSAVGMRLFVAGLMQILRPSFTAKQIFHIDGTECLPVIRELGFANVCFGLAGIISFFKPEWREMSAFCSGIYYGLAGIQHIVKKPAGANETFALVTDMGIFAVLAAYVLCFL